MNPAVVILEESRGSGLASFCFRMHGSLFTKHLTEIAERILAIIGTEQYLRKEICLDLTGTEPPFFKPNRFAGLCLMAVEAIAREQLPVEIRVRIAVEHQAFLADVCGDVTVQVVGPAASLVGEETSGSTVANNSTLEQGQGLAATDWIIFGACLALLIGCVVALFLGFGKYANSVFGFALVFGSGILAAEAVVVMGALLRRGAVSEKTE